MESLAKNGFLNDSLQNLGKFSIKFDVYQPMAKQVEDEINRKKFADIFVMMDKDLIERQAKHKNCVIKKICRTALSSWGQNNLSQMMNP